MPTSPVPSTSDGSDKVVIFIADQSEALDVFQCFEAFQSFGMKVFLASFQNTQAIHLKGSISVFAHITIEEARSKRWRLIFLPSGNARAIARFMECQGFLELLREHLDGDKERMVAACGSFACEGLPSLGYVDPLGPTCYPLEGTKLVLREYKGQVWTSPGLGTSLEMALAIGDHLYGRENAYKVSKALLYTRRLWKIDAPDEKKDVSELPDETTTQKSGNNNELRHVPNHALTETSQESKPTESPPKEPSPTKRRNRSGFWKIVWPELRRMGWDSESGAAGNWIFQKMSKRNERGVDWFDSQQSVLDYLDTQLDPQSTKIMRRFHECTGTKPSIDVLKKKRKLLDQQRKKEKGNTKRKTEQEMQKKRRTEEEEREIVKLVDPLFEHVAWTRLKRLGWKRRLLSGSSRREPVFCPPNGSVELVGHEEVMRFLIQDPGWYTNQKSLCIVDLFRQCQKVRKTLQHATTPAYIEYETKRRMPALATY